ELAGDHHREQYHVEDELASEEPQARQRVPDDRGEHEHARRLQEVDERRVEEGPAYGYLREHRAEVVERRLARDEVQVEELARPLERRREHVEEGQQEAERAEGQEQVEEQPPGGAARAFEPAADVAGHQYPTSRSRKRRWISVTTKISSASTTPIVAA